MTELEFVSTISLEKIEKNFQDADLVSGLIEALQEVLAFEANGQGVEEESGNGN